MPLYNNSVPPTSVAFGEDATIVNAETVGAANRSQRVAIADKRTGIPRPVTLTFKRGCTATASEKIVAR